MIIDKIAKRLGRKYKFGYHDLDDMQQQARMFAWEGLDNYDQVRPLENYLWTHVHNRLFNYKRDKFERLDCPCNECGHMEGGKCSLHLSLDCCKSYHGWVKRNNAKKNLMKPIDLEGVQDEKENGMRVQCEVEEDIDNNALLVLINKFLPLQFRMDFLKMKSGTKISKVKREQVQEQVRAILEQNGYQT